MKRVLAAIGLSAWSSLAGAGTGDAHFAQRFALDLDGNAPYYAVTVPQAVYAASLHGDLGDLRVLNGAGEPVPYSLDAPAPAGPPPQRRPVHWFPLPAADGGTRNAPLGVSVAADGSLHATATPPRAGRSADLVDLARVDGQVEALLIHLRNDSYQGRVSVETSNDLRSWQPLTDTQLLKVSYDGNTLTQERIELDGARGRYLRLNWPDGAPEIASAEVELRTDDASAATPRQWRDGARVRAGQSPGEYLFETDGAYPVDRLRLDLPQPNTVAHATAQSRANAQAPWRDVANGVLFRLRGQSGDQRNRPLELQPDRDRAWRIVVDTRNGGLGGGMPSVVVGWRPASLTFLARGAPPFTLAVGNARLVSAAVRRDELLIGAGTAISSARVGHALPVSPQEARAAAATEDADATRRHVLWAALVVAVGALGTIAWRLSRGGGTQDRESR
ncbi:Protein of unknown function DUF3999 [Burkholderia sp. lig30]|jgi:hypothetical protein|uniref:DUF3999 domain-containing protein n=1 Tax=Burkholderia sp. lig30 TaxID=1192124 RepID=UPI000460FA51|nr:DUF3999 domain-containing protein [Burkholderia sp. lig30]KDB06076.1 Protein of unknown function DUF3999 [Burkholderia sp. lig30]